MSTTQSSYDYEDFKPKRETTNTPESHLLFVHIPDGFTKGDIGAKVEYDFGRVRVFGERSTENNKRSRFDEKYQVPSYCDIGNIKGKFDGNIITITMPIIPGAKVPPKQEQEAPQPEPVVQESQQKDQGNDKEEDDKDAAAEVKDQKGNQDPKSTAESKEDAAHVTSTPQEEQKVSVPQKGQQEISQEAQVSEVESKGKADHETLTTHEQEATQKSSMPQKGEEETSQKAQLTKFESMGEVDHETSTTPEAKEDSMPQKGEEKATVTKDAKLQTGENTAGLNDENMKKQTVGKEETKDHHKKESKEESEVSAEKGKEMMNGKFGDDSEKKSEKRGIPESRTRIKEMAASTTQAVTNLAKRFSEEDKQKLIYTGAAILVVGLGVYASYKYRSSRKS